MTVPHYDDAGRLLQPKGYKTWVHVGVNLGIGYQENTEEPTDPGQFMNVYMQPESYRHYEQTGRFPEKTMLALVQYKPEKMGAIARTGLMSGDHVGLSFAVKDSEKFEESWAYFGFATREGFRDAAGSVSEASLLQLPRRACEGRTTCLCSSTPCSGTFMKSAQQHRARPRIEEILEPRVISIVPPGDSSTNPPTAKR